MNVRVRVHHRRVGCLYLAQQLEASGPTQQLLVCHGPCALPAFPPLRADTYAPADNSVSLAAHVFEFYLSEHRRLFSRSSTLKVAGTWACCRSNHPGRQRVGAAPEEERRRHIPSRRPCLHCPEVLTGDAGSWAAPGCERCRGYGCRAAVVVLVLACQRSDASIRYQWCLQQLRACIQQRLCLRC